MVRGWKRRGLKGWGTDEKELGEGRVELVGGKGIPG
jgi:hypothetical protein